jgi:hypothetical protein
MVTPAVQKRTKIVTVNGRQQKQVVQVANLRGKFKQKGKHYQPPFLIH